jgi:hypothetical protein
MAYKPEDCCMETSRKLSSSIEYHKHALQLLKENTTSVAYTDVAGAAKEDTDTAGGVPMKQVSYGNGLFDHATLENAAAVYLGYVEANALRVSINMRCRGAMLRKPLATRGQCT